MEEKMQFDSALGGYEDLPHEVHVLKFAAARSREISAMTECITNPCSTKLVFQSLPVHMRRRIMSHNSKRLPRRLRIAHESQLNKSGQPLRQKRPSRKFRRRPEKLLTEYNRRQRIHTWLETHIWHAKRFHMTARWGYKLAEAPCDKAFRACYRASSKHCLLQDISYYNSLQISGKIDELVAGFKKITSPKCGLSITANAYLNSEREGTAYIFHVDTYPFECIGKITFFWKPCNNNKQSERCLWMFAHPSFYNELIDALTKCFNLSKISEKMENNLNSSKDPKRIKLDHKMAFSKDHLPQLKYKNDTSIKMQDIQDTINRFRLTGPLSHAILSEALSPLSTSKTASEKKLSWFNSFLKESFNFKSHEMQTIFWNKFKNLTSPGELPCHLIVGLNVKDPRVNLQRKRFKAIPNDVNDLSSTDFVVMPVGINHSALWDSDVRKQVSEQKMANRELNQMAEKFSLVPGYDNSNFYDVPGVPLLLIQRPGSQMSQQKRLGYNSGWDVIVPNGYAMPIWMSLILRGARAGGLRESDNLAFESGTCHLQPDTLAAGTEASRQLDLLRDRYFRLPPNRRVNFLKLSINSPFICRWQTLINDWKMSADPAEEYFVLRDKIVLSQLNNMVQTKKTVPDFTWNINCLVPVRVLSVKRAKIGNFSLICLPNEGDNLSNKCAELVEPLNKDSNQSQRNQLRKTHKQILKKLRRRCIQSKTKILEEAKKYVHVPKQDNSTIIKEHAETMKDLWLPSKVDNVRNQCTRQVLGYVTKGGFCFTEAQTMGVGYVALSSILSVIQSNSKNKKCFVLTRTTLSRQYRFATLEIAER